MQYRTSCNKGDGFQSVLPLGMIFVETKNQAHANNGMRSLIAQARPSSLYGTVAASKPVAKYKEVPASEVRK